MASDPDSPVVVAEMASEHEAALAVGHLESLGITAHIWGSDAGGVWAESPANVRVAVRRSDAARARAALAEIRGRHAGDTGRQTSG
jgi:hypothetical protein